VLGILSHGEAEARAFVIGISADAPAASTDAPGEAGDAARLAARLRMLALVLCVLLARGCALPGAADPRACWPSRKFSAPAVRRLDAPAPPVSDTS
jgi:hypothetical protein